MRKHILGIAVFVCQISSIAGIAQSTVTTTGGTTNTVPVFTGTTAVGNSPIAVNGSNVGIGTSAPGYPLQVNGSAMIGIPGTTAGAIGIVPNNSDSWFWIDNPSANYLRFSNGGSPGNNPVVITNSGRVGIGTATPSQPLEVNGNAKVDGALTVSGTGGLEVQTSGITFPDGTVQTTAYPASSSGGSAPIQVVNNEAVINGGISANGTGIKHVRTNTGCTTPDTFNATCTILVDWPGTAFADTNYTATCTPKLMQVGNVDDATTPVIYITDANKTPTSITVTVLSYGGEGSVTGLNCIAIHD